MKRILIRLAYMILTKFPLESLPFLYFNGVEYQATSIEYKHQPNGKETLIVTAKRRFK